LSSQKGIRKAADEIKDFLSKEGLGIDVLFNNAGINISQRSLIEEGIELQFGTNHVGPFLFTNLLLPLLLSPSSSSSASSAGKGQKRIVMTSSEAHRISPVRFSDYNLEPGQKVKKEDEPRRGLPKGVLRGGGAYEPAVAYGQSKTANVLFAVGLNQRLNKDGVKSFAVMPGSKFFFMLI
jgi:NAD(P)-dependent dehydrogenase (short-subunit alcohol dehydrogenase family)